MYTNYEYYKKLQKKEFKKNFLFIFIVVLFAFFSTYIIYNSVKEERDEILKSKSLEVIYHDNGVGNINIKKSNPVSDNVGLSSKPYKFTVKNETNKQVKYNIKIIDNADFIKDEGCTDKLIPHNIIKIGVHKKGEVSEIINMDDLKDDVLFTEVLEPNQISEWTIRVWIASNSLIMTKDLHYHGRIIVEE